MTTLVLNCLGAFEATLNAKPVTAFPTDKIRALLTYLALEPAQPHRREQLADLLWPEISHSLALTNLRVTLHRLRKTFDKVHPGSGAVLIMSTRQSIQLNPDLVTVDVLSFRTLLATPITHTHPALHRCDACLALLAQAMDLYRGELLTGFGVTDAFTFEEWLLLRREALHQQALATMLTLAQIYEQQGSAEQAHHYASRLLTLEPSHEEAHRQLMRTLARFGLHKEALAQYEICRRLLREELDIEPDPKTDALYEQIRSGAITALETREDVDERSRAERASQRSPNASFPGVPSHAVAAPTPHKLPVQVTPFIGRRREMAAILQHLHDPNVRLLTLVGAGGMGKTRLAVEVARLILASSNTSGATGLPPFPDGLFFVSLAPLNRATKVAVAVASAVGLNLTGGEPQQMVRRFLQDKRLLLIMDNFEHLLIPSVAGQESTAADATDKSTVQLVVDLLRTAPGVKILATSRERLNLQGEHLYAVLGMGIARTTTLTAAKQAAAARLFVQSAQRVQPNFALNELNLSALLRICRLVEGMPLGLELAAAWVEMLTLDEIAQEIEKSLDFLTVDWPEIPARQRSMRAVFEWSWRLLNAAERQVLCRLSVFKGGFMRVAAEQIAGASLRTLTSLMQKSMLRRSESSSETNDVRYELHELLRQFAAEQLATRPHQQRATEKRHSAFYLAFVADRERRLARDEPKEAALEIQGDLDNVRQAWVWAVHHGSVSWLDGAAYALRLFYTFTSLEAEGEQFFQLAIDHLRTMAVPAQGPPLLSKLLGFQAILLIAQLKQAEAMAATQEAIQLCAAAPAGERSREGETFGHLALGIVLTIQSPSPEARHQLEQALLLAQRYQPAASAGQAPTESLYDAEWVAHLSLRDLDLYEDNYPSAVAHVQQAVQLCRSLGKLRGEMNCLIHLADPLIKMQNYAAAAQACQQALQLARALNNRWGEGYSRQYLGNATRLLGKYGEAQALLASAYAILNADSDLSQEAISAAWLGHLYNLMGATKEARTWFDLFLSLLQQFHAPWEEVEMEGLLPLALFCHHNGENEQALAYATRAWQIGQHYGGRQGQAQALIVCGHAQAELQQRTAAQTSYQQALALCQTPDNLHLGIEARAGLARLALHQADLAQAQSQVESILPVLESHPQAGMDEPFLVYLTCYGVLTAVEDPRAAMILQRGQELLRQYACHIHDAALRHSFLTKVATHRALHQASTYLLSIPVPA